MPRATSWIDPSARKREFPSAIISCWRIARETARKDAVDSQVETRRGCILSKRPPKCCSGKTRGERLFIERKEKARAWSQNRRIKGEWALPSPSCPEQPLSLVHPYEVIADRQGSRSNDTPSVNQAISFLRDWNEDSIFFGPRRLFRPYGFCNIMCLSARPYAIFAKR